MKIKVKSEDSKLGVRNSPSKCMVARAIERALPNPHLHVEVLCYPSDDEETDEWFAMVDETEYPLPTNVGERILRWDHGIEIEPFEFELDIDHSTGMAPKGEA